MSVRAGYDGWAPSYDTVRNPTRDASLAQVDTWMPHLAGNAVLELGCGTGLVTEKLVACAAQVTALDFSQGMLELAMRRAPAARFLQHDLAQPLPFADAAFDVVIESLVLEHIQDLVPVLRETHRVLRPGGQMLLTELHPYKQYGGSQARFVAEGGGEIRIPAFTHDISDFIAAAVAGGFAVLEMTERRDADGALRLLALRLGA